MQLLNIIDTTGFDDWKQGFDGRTEDRMNAGLTLLQMWHSADKPNRVICLYEANDRGKAESYLKKTVALADHVEDSSHHFLRTA